MFEKRKTRNYPCVPKTENTQLSLCQKNGNSTSRTGIGSRKKKEVISNSKTTTMTYFDELKKKQQYQRGKYIYFSFRSEL